MPDKATSEINYKLIINLSIEISFFFAGDIKLYCYPSNLIDACIEDLKKQILCYV